MSTKTAIHRGLCLWKTLVEKSVENVEKFWISTEKPGI